MEQTKRLECRHKLSSDISNRVARIFDTFYHESKMNGKTSRDKQIQFQCITQHTLQILKTQKGENKKKKSNGNLL